MKMNLRVMVATFLAICHWVGDARAEVLATCTGMSGYSHYLSDDGFVEDGTQGTGFVLYREDDEYDIGLADIAGPRRVTDDGGRVVGTVRPDGLIVVLVAYPQLSGIETYVFDLARRTMTLSQARVGGIVPKSSVFVSMCL